MNRDDKGKITRKEKELKELEDEFFGQPNALKYKSNEIGLTEKAEEPIEKTRNETRKAIESVGNPNDPTNVIDRLQVSGRLPESLHTPTLVKCLKFLGRMGFRIVIGEKETLFPENKTTLNLTENNLAIFLKRGAIAAALLLPFTAAGQTMEEGMEIATESVGTINPGLEGNTIIHWETILILILLALGMGLAAYKILKNFKKNKQTKKTKQKFNEYEEAKRSGTPEGIKEAKKSLFTDLMGELPEDMDNTVETTDIADVKDLEKGFGYKKMVDDLIKKVMESLEKEAILPARNTVASLNTLRDKLLRLIEKYFKELEDLFEKLADEWQKIHDTDGPDYLLKQLEFEKKKLKYIMDYLNWIKKKWLQLIQSVKNQLLASTPAGRLSETEKIQKEIFDLQKRLNDLLDSQVKKTPTDFQHALRDLEDALDEKTETAKSAGIPGYEKDEAKLVGGDTVKLLNNGEYNDSIGVNYVVNGHSHHIDLVENVTVEMWINEQNKLKMNFNFKGVAVDSKELMVHNGNLHIKQNGGTPGPSLQQYIKSEQGRDDLQTVAPITDIGPEATPILNELARRFQTVHSRIKHNDYKIFGDKVEADDETIEYHNIRIEREYYGGKEKAVIRFILSEGKWKKALAGLHKQTDIPKHTVHFNFEGPGGLTKGILQPMLRFNIKLKNNKQVAVLVPSDSKYKAMEGEIRILFDKEIEYSDEEVKTVFTKVAKQLGIQGDITLVTPAAKEKLRERLKQISKTSGTAAGATVEIHPEYAAEQMTPQVVEGMKQKGLHSVYHQFNLDGLEEVFRIKKVLATTTRWSKGILKEGMSSTADLGSGGATEVFMRIHTKNSVNSWSTGKPAIVFKPDLLRRMDCYCYSSDKFGSKLPGTFDQRISPEKLVEMMVHNYNPGHEIMFHDAIDLSDANAAYIVCASSSQVADIKKRLQKIEVTNFGGKPLAEAVITHDQFKYINL